MSCCAKTRPQSLGAPADVVRVAAAPLPATHHVSPSGAGPLASCRPEMSQCHADHPYRASEYEPWYMCARTHAHRRSNSGWWFICTWIIMP